MTVMPALWIPAIPLLDVSSLQLQQISATTSTFALTTSATHRRDAKTDLSLVLQTVWIVPQRSAILSLDALPSRSTAAKIPISRKRLVIAKSSNVRKAMAASWSFKRAELSMHADFAITLEKFACLV
jgi:hypothetical protein